MTLLRSAKVVLGAVVLCAASFAQMLPQPQIASAEGKPAPEFTLRDQNGRTFSLSSTRGSRVLLVFYRGYWWPYCTAQLREFAQHKEEFDGVRTRIIGISVDEPKNSLALWNELHRKFTLLSDPGARVIRKYGVLHAGGNGQDIALDTILFVDRDGRERWRRVSQSLPDLPKAEEVVNRIQETIRPQQPVR